MANVKNKKDIGFTLVEIVIAVAVLSISLITLLGLQASATSEAVRTRNKQSAMLMARRIMSNIELDTDLLTDKSVNGTAEELLNQFGTSDPADSSHGGTEATLMGDLNIQSWKIEGLPEDSIKRIQLKVSWSASPEDKVEVIYFVPSPGKE